MSLWSESCFFGCLLAEPTSFSKKTKKWKKNNALEMVPDQTQLRLKTFMIRSNCARSRLWSDKSALESAYDQTFQTKMSSDQTISRPWSDRSALELPKRPCNFGLGTHGCALDWVWSEVNLGLDLNLGSCSVFCDISYLLYKIEQPLFNIFRLFMFYKQLIFYQCTLASVVSLNVKVYRMYFHDQKTQCTYSMNQNRSQSKNNHNN